MEEYTSINIVKLLIREATNIHIEEEEDNTAIYRNIDTNETHIIKLDFSQIMNKIYAFELLSCCSGDSIVTVNTNKGYIKKIGSRLESTIIYRLSTDVIGLIKRFFVAIKVDTVIISKDCGDNEFIYLESDNIIVAEMEPGHEYETLKHCVRTHISNLKPRNTINDSSIYDILSETRLHFPYLRRWLIDCPEEHVNLVRKHCPSIVDIRIKKYSKSLREL